MAWKGKKGVSDQIDQFQFALLNIVTTGVTIRNYHWTLNQTTDIWIGYLDYAVRELYVKVESMHQMTVYQANFYHHCIILQPTVARTDSHKLHVVTCTWIVIYLDISQTLRLERFYGWTLDQTTDLWIGHIDYAARGIYVTIRSPNDCLADGISNKECK